MKNRLVLLALVIVGGFNSLVFSNDFGATGALKESGFTLEEMLGYAIQDEYLALNEYEALVEKFGLSRPYTNIIQAEKTHIGNLEELYNDHNLAVPSVDTSSHLYIPKDL